MADIRHRVGIEAPIETVFESLATIDGLAGWWTRDVRGDATLGGELQFFFGGPEASCVMQVIDSDPAALVRWRCVGGPDEWLGTEFTFALSEAGAGETVILFTNSGWREPVEFMHHCSTKWAYFLLGLKDGLEAGKAKPFPEDAKISSWG